MAARYWVGGTANWDATAGAKWATTSGGAGGAAVPTASDDVYFDAASGAVTVTVSASVNCRSLIFTGFTGTFAGSSVVSFFGPVLTASASMTWTHTGNLGASIASGTVTITSNGKVITSALLCNTAGTVELADAYSSTNSITVLQGTFTTNDYNVTATSLSSNNSNTRTINLGGSTVTVNGAVGINFGAAGTATNLTFNAGTSSIVLPSASGYVAGGSKDFYNISYTSTAGATFGLEAVNSANDISVTGRTSAGVAQLSVLGNTTVNGTLTLSAGTNATMRTFVRSNTIGTTRTLTCAAVASLQDIDFRDITIAGAAAPVSGTRLGDCKGNSGITFDAPKTVYFRLTGSGPYVWGGNAWAFTSSGALDYAAFPLAQDTVNFPSVQPASGGTVTVNAAYNIGTIDMSARTSNTMTLATGTTTPQIYGNWINGTGTTLTGTQALTFAGRGSRTITSAGKTFTQRVATDTPGGSVTLQDALIISAASTSAIDHISGTFDANGYNVTLTGSTSAVRTSYANLRTLALGSGTWTIAGTGGWVAATSTNLTVTGTGTISLTSATSTNFQGGGIQTYPTINQGGTGTLTITGSNKFADITNTAIGRVQFSGGTTNEFGAFNLNGVSGNLLQVGSTNTTQAILKKPGAWNVGANSTDAGNNTGLTFA